MYKDKEKQKEANRLAAKKARLRRHTPVIPSENVIPVTPNASYPKMKEVLLQDPEVKKEYDKLEPKYKKIKEKIQSRIPQITVTLPHSEDLQAWREERWKAQESRDLALQK